ncbi:hypothetical protein DPMN_149509 [Dreissena polymorpha]|uniref:Palmitoyltransferase n=1 Tax=Dreissena polymorpha TaxID=45954 RepID=A0A9D4FHI7_DREPO|nr:hypothetical protein DPMN_149509 [Dreissena polymorpha]
MLMGDVEAAKVEPSRKNGWNLPPSRKQVVAWTVLIILGVLHFTSLVPALRTSWQPVAHIVPAVVLTFHLIVHLTAMSIDPSDDNVLQNKCPKLKIDRSKHEHVIENSHCNICQVDVAVTSKHCRACNKCVQNFDHHCEYMNTCIGGKNYRWFIATVVSAVVAIAWESGLAVMEFVTYFTDQASRRILQPYIDLGPMQHYKEADFKIFLQSVPHEVWLTMLAVYFVLGFLAIALFGQLLGYHIYFIYHNMSTYDYILAQRRKSQEVVASNKKCCHKKKNKVHPAPDSSPTNYGNSTSLSPPDIQTPTDPENNNNSSKLAPSLDQYTLHVINKCVTTNRLLPPLQGDKTAGLQTVVDIEM